MLIQTNWTYWPWRISSTVTANSNFVINNDWYGKSTLFIEVNSWFTWTITISGSPNWQSFYWFSDWVFAFNWTETWENLKVLYTIQWAIPKVWLDIAVSAWSVKESFFAVTSLN